MMHIKYEKQLEVKKNTVINNLRKIAHLSEDDYEFDGIIPSDEYAYRNKAQFPVAMENGKAVYGFYASGSHRVVRCEECKIQNEKINRTAEAVLEYINENRISVYDEKTGKGLIRHIYVRASADGKAIVTLIVNSRSELPFKEKLVEKLTAVGGVAGIVQNVNMRSDNVILGNENITLFGNADIELSVDGLRFTVSPHSFFQVNLKQTERLYAKALEYAELSGSETVFDLYCGVGSISLYMARSAKTVYGVEIVEAAVENAKVNARLNGIENARFYAGDCTKIVDKLVGEGKKADVVVVDPPRKGCDNELFELIDKLSPEKLVYVSCNSATLARDIGCLEKIGYSLKRVSAVDMFPQTAHVECVALITKANQ